jgi:hypothetical protein
VGKSAYLGDRAVARLYNERLLVQALQLFGAVERCFNLISEGDEEFGSSMPVSAGKGRAEI